METSNNNAKLVGALLVGAAIGGVLGILFAPKKGSETRKNLLSKGEDLSDSIKDHIDELVEKSKKGVETMKANHSSDHKSVKA